MWDSDKVGSKIRKPKKNSGNIHVRGYHSSSIINNSRYNISPLKPVKNVKIKNICAMDLETIELNKIQIPVAISFAYFDNNNQIKTIFKLIDKELLLINFTTALQNMWMDFFTDISKLNYKQYIIYSHNLGSFDGYFIYKALLEIPNININNISSIIDDKHKFISIEVTLNNIKFIWKDSLRVFPISLNELCKMFDVPGKLSTYNQEFNTIHLFNNLPLLNDFKEYSIQDSVSLLKALTKAQLIYLNKYTVDLSRVWSTSTLSLKIFRQHFLNKEIPILSYDLDREIRPGYFGGSTDYFHKYGENLYYYDVNTLYPKAMCNQMPCEYIETVDDCTNIKLEDIFGYCKAKIITPNNLMYPLLPHKIDGDTVHPIGTWVGIYFSEELKFVKEHGYKVELITVHKFSKEDVFTNYVNHFYNEKKISSGSERFIAKMHLNQLYGYFGRKLDVIQTKNIYTDTLIEHIENYTVEAIIGINDLISTILVTCNLTYKLNSGIAIKDDSLNLSLLSPFKKVKSNVAIASAVTSYARIYMYKHIQTLLKLKYKIFYMDTDSLFIDKPLPLDMVGSDLGLFKDELEGDFINKAYFLGIKKYGYITNTGKVFTVFSGVKRNSLTFEEVEQIARGYKLLKISGFRFFKSFKDLIITIKKTPISIEYKPLKKCINNIYYPIKTKYNKFYSYRDIRLYELKIINRIKHLIKKYIKILISNNLLVVKLIKC